MRSPSSGWLFRHSDLRLAVTAALTLGFTTLTGIAFGYYATLAVLSVMGSNFGSSLALGRQRVLGTLLGGLVLLVFYEGLAGIPMPLGLALALALQRLLGGLLNLQVGYKAGGMVIVMGWLVHSDQFAPWLSLRLFWTVFGIITSLLSLRLLWPESALDSCWQGWSALFGALAADLRRHGLASPAPGSTSQAKVAMAVHNKELRGRLIAQRAAMPAIRDELGGAGPDHPLMQLLAGFDENGSRLIGLLQGLERHRRRDEIPALQPLERGEAALLLAIAARLALWSTCLSHRRRLAQLPPPPPEPLAPPADWRLAEQLLAQPLPQQLPLEQLQPIAARHQLCRQAWVALERLDQLWHAAAT